MSSPAPGSTERFLATDAFHFVGEKVENLFSYKPGGFHPVHLGDTFPNPGQPRYRVMHKLGRGSFATVWLAEDMAQKGRAVALKIPIAISGGQNVGREASILKSIADNAKRPHRHQGHIHVLELLDHFQIAGPNGTHDGLVTDILVPLDMVQFAKMLDPKRASYEVLLGLAFLHQQGICHGDLHADNIAFKLATLHDVSSKDWLNGIDTPSVIPLVPRKYQEPTNSTPRYVVETADTDDFFVDRLRKARREHLTAIIMDFGNACRRSDVLPDPCTPLAYQPPEVTFKISPQDPSKSAQLDEFDTRMKSDIWSLGCTISEIVTGGILFGRVYNEQNLIDHMIERLGPLPPHLYDSMDRKPYPDIKGTPQRKVAEKWWNRWEDAQLASLVHKMVQYDPSSRPRAEDLITHPWFYDVRDSGHSL